MSAIRDRVARVTVRPPDAGAPREVPATVTAFDTERSVRSHVARFWPGWAVLGVTFGHSDDPERGTA